MWAFSQLIAAIFNRVQSIVCPAIIAFCLIYGIAYKLSEIAY